jgi:hypothetical protein
MGSGRHQPRPHRRQTGQDRVQRHPQLVRWRSENVAIEIKTHAIVTKVSGQRHHRSRYGGGESATAECPPITPAVLAQGPRRSLDARAELKF